MDLSDPAHQLLVAKTMEYAFRMEAVAKAYYAEHQKNGRTCDLCGQYELAYTSIAHAARVDPV